MVRQEYQEVKISDSNSEDSEVLKEFHRVYEAAAAAQHQSISHCAVGVARLYTPSGNRWLQPSHGSIGDKGQGHTCG